MHVCTYLYVHVNRRSCFPGKNLRFEASYTYVCQGFIWGQIFGGEPTHLFICMYEYTHMRGTVWRGMAQA